MLWIPAFAGMTEETDGLDKSSLYPSLGTQNSKLVTCILTDKLVNRVTG
jgi:hypothetical protein